VQVEEMDDGVDLMRDEEQDELDNSKDSFLEMGKI